jgi:hypothetical protein
MLRSLLAGGLTALLLAIAAAPAAALTIQPNPMPIDDGGFGIIGGSLELIDATIGLPAGGIVGAGAVGATDTTLVFEASAVLSFGSAWNIVAIALGPAGGGGSLIAPTALGSIGAGGSFSIFSILNETGRFIGTIPVGTTSSQFFISWAGPLPGDGSLQIGAVAGEGIDFGNGSALLVAPEPGSALLLIAAALLGTARAVRRGR